MISSVIAHCARRRVQVFAVVAVAAIAALACLPRVSLDALPDVSDTQVIVTADWPGRGADLVDQQIATPLALVLRALPGVRYVRASSMTGDAFVYAVFNDGVPVAEARTRVAEGLAGLRDQLPEGVVARLGPDASSVGWIYEYALVDTSGRLDLSDLRSLQDRWIRLRLQTVPGIAEVAAVGGHVARYEVALDPARLAAYHLPLSTIAEVIRQSNRDAGSGVLQTGGQELVVSGRAQIQSLKELAALPVTIGSGGAILRLGDLGRVRFGTEPRRGIAEMNGRGEVVGGIVVMRQHENAMRVLERLKRRIDEIRPTLPPGVKLIPTYDRSELLRRSLATLRRALLIEALVVSLVIVFFLGSLRSAMVPIVLLPIANMLAFLPLALARSAVNIMSLGGVAIAAGVMVDGAIILIESAHKELEQRPPGSAAERQQQLIRAMSVVGRPIFFSLLIITVSFLPLLALQDVEGRTFRPLVLAKTYAMAFAALLTITLTPALAALWIPSRVRPEFHSGLFRRLAVGYSRVVRASISRPAPLLVVAALLLLAAVPGYRSLGHEFMPEMDEGDLLYMPSSPAGLSIDLAAQTLHRQDSVLAAAPEVLGVFGKAGRAVTATDPAPLSMFETVVTLRPDVAFSHARERRRLVDRLDASVRTPGFSGVWWMPIRTRQEMLATGVRSPVGIKVFGPDPAAIESLSATIAECARTLPGVSNAYAERVARTAALDLNVRRERAAVAGLSPNDVQDVAVAAISGVSVSQVFLGRTRVNVSLQLEREPSGGVAGLLHVPIATPTGATVELGDVVDAHWRDAPAMLQQEDGEQFGLVSLEVSGSRAAAAAQSAIARSITLPTGYHIEWSGQYSEYARARARLVRIIPLAILSVCLLLLWSLRSAVDALLVLLAVPFSLTGAIALLGLLHFQISVAVWVGLLALAGLDAETGTVMLLYLRMAVDERRDRGQLRSIADLDEAISAGAAKRLRPKLMTVCAILLGLLPILLESGPGADVLKRVATPMVGGVISSFVMELFLYPCLYRLAHRRRVRFANGDSQRVASSTETSALPEFDSLSR